MNLRKDEALVKMKQSGLNVGRFFCVTPNGEIENYVMEGELTDKTDIKEALKILLSEAKSKRVNIRMFSDEKTKGFPMFFNKSIDDLDELIEKIEENIKDGIYSLVNENIDIADKGVSGVIYNGVVEFAPEDTPKVVEKPGVTSLPYDIANDMLFNVYGVSIGEFSSVAVLDYYYKSQDLTFDEIKNTDSTDFRIEFSIHPEGEGIFNEKYIVWEIERQVTDEEYFPVLTKDNKFSNFIGEKLFGLLFVNALGLNVPNAYAITRNIPYISIPANNDSCKTMSKRIRTIPFKKEAGLYDTLPISGDIFEFMNEQEAKSNDSKPHLSGLLIQDEIQAEYSGAAIVNKNSVIIEGVKGFGDDFMLGSKKEELPGYVSAQVQSEISRLNMEIFDYIKGYTIEWVYKDEVVYIVQFNILEQNEGSSTNIVPGSPEEYVEFNPEDGLDELRKLINKINSSDKDIGIVVTGFVGITSHVGDLLRIHNIPSYIKY